MRMWMVPPEQMCRQHLIGEHGELHKAVGVLRHSKKWTNNLIDAGYLEPQNFLSRHDALAQEMVSRGYNHKSPLDIADIELREGKIDMKVAKKELRDRCEECRKLMGNKGGNGVKRE